MRSPTSITRHHLGSKLARGRRSVVAIPAYLAHTGMPSVPADLAHHHALAYSQLGDQGNFRNGNTETSVTVRGLLWPGAAERIRAAVLADMRLTVAADPMFAPELTSGAVRRVLPEWQLSGAVRIRPRPWDGGLQRLPCFHR